MPKFATVAEYVAALPDTQREIAEQLVPLITAALPASAVWHGHPVWRLTPSGPPLCLIKAYPGHVTFGFWHGQTFTDPSARLRPSGSQQMASVKLHSVADIDPDLFTAWLTQARS